MADRKGRIVLGVVTIVPLLGIAGWLAYAWPFVQMLIGEAFASAGDISPTLIAGSRPPMAILVGSMLLGVLVWGYYQTWVLRTNRLGGWAKAGWSLALCLAGLVAMPVLWWRHFRGGR